MLIQYEVFKKSTPIFNKLEQFGFIKNNNKYTYTKNFHNNEFKLVFTINNDKLETKVIDNDINEEYFAINIKNETSTFINEVKNECKQILEDIKSNCFTTSVFTYSQTNRIVELINNKYHNQPEFLWEGYDYGVFRNKDNKKWYGIIMNLENIKSKDYPHDIEVINIKLNRDKIQILLNKEGFYKAYHMNKLDWISIALNNTLKDSEIISLIEESYNLVKQKREDHR